MHEIFVPVYVLIHIGIVNYGMRSSALLLRLIIVATHRHPVRVATLSAPSSHLVHVVAPEIAE